ncbi:glycerophosphodiester phosphodiesterase [Wenjunlia vitaminophila]|uniref:Glycerophosphodiester phosphodiesterase n=1 Tax=Wenjunlia vitaminophila TaxID=76728 RepID=A0A0T6LQZ6_WENVI|nr:glycerophosphodiester phosphodiesterase family protein [Wenjunlia vitaminophila]KRV48220.1 glycerophosphodiester phosphodiesterase [Wenjunlia vitaminophila]
MFRRLVSGSVTVTLLTTALIAGAAAAHATESDQEAAQSTTPAAISDRTTVVAHRGASAYAPENTLAAVRKADDLGILWVENDVQRTKDGELVIMHDTTLKRTTDVEERFPGRSPWKVADFTLEEIRTLDAGSWKGAEFTGERVPTLEEYVNLLDDTGQNLLMEIKAPELYPGIEEQIVDVLDDEGWLDRRHIQRKLITQSFSADSVETFHALVPEAKTGFLGTPSIDNLPKYAEFADQINPRFADVTPEYVKAVHEVKGAHGKPLEVFTWTVNDADTARRVADAGVDGIITNYPDLVRGVVNNTTFGPQTADSVSGR